MLRLCLFLVGLLAAVTALADAQQPMQVRDDAGLRRALENAQAGSRILIASGQYGSGIYLRDLHGTKERPIVIAGVDEKDPPVFVDGNEGWHLSNCEYLVLRNISVRGQRQNGINVDDGGDFDTPSHHIALENIRVSDIGPKGNFDGIKLSGVTDFFVRRCQVAGWGGQAIDMVGCHRGLIEHCTFRGKPGFSQTAGPQTKGGSSRVVIRRCTFLQAGDRGVNIGGSTGLPYFRPQGAKYEARDITVEGCTFVGGEAPIAFVGVDGATVRYNTFYRPGKWLMRILQETTEPGFVPSRNGTFTRNLVVFRSDEVRVAVNIGSHTQADTFRFADNFWFCQDQPASSRPDLPTQETGGVHGLDPKFRSAQQLDFAPTNRKAVPYGASAWERSKERGSRNQ